MRAFSYYSITAIYPKLTYLNGELPLDDGQPYETEIYHFAQTPRLFDQCVLRHGCSSCHPVRCSHCMLPPPNNLNWNSSSTNSMHPTQTTSTNHTARLHEIWPTHAWPNYEGMVPGVSLLSGLTLCVHSLICMSCSKTGRFIPFIICPPQIAHLIITSFTFSSFPFRRAM